MKILLNSTELLSRTLYVRDRKGKQQRLCTLGEAARFIHFNFSAQRILDVDVRNAFATLQSAIRDANQRDHATNTVKEALQTEGLFESE